MFRIGGDEFATVLRGDDYNNKDLLMKEIEERVAFAEKISDVSEGAASFAYGIAEYDSSADDGAAQVIKRANEQMLERKSVMKFSKWGHMSKA